MSKLDNLHDFFEDLANAIREREGSSGLINPQDMAVRIAAIMDKEVTKNSRTTLRELLKDIADSIRIAEESNALINPQDMSARVLALIKEFYINIPDEVIWLTEANDFSQDVEVKSNTSWTIE